MLPVLRKWKQISAVRSGQLAIRSGRLWYAGYYGYGWSRAAQNYNSATDANAYYLRISDIDTLPSDGPSNRYYGFPLRCLAD